MNMNILNSSKNSDISLEEDIIEEDDNNINLLLSHLNLNEYPES